jgi:hypothetical protein
MARLIVSLDHIREVREVRANHEKHAKEIFSDWTFVER